MNMKRLFISLFFILYCGLINAGEPLKLAIIGSEETADLLFAELTKNADFELLEREALQAMLTEHKLDSLNAASFTSRFPHAEIFVVFRTRDIIIFDVRNGTLIGKFLKPARKPPEPAEQLRQLTACLTACAVRRRNQSKLPPVSILTVTDSGAPADFRDAYFSFADALEKHITEDPDAICFERRSLGTVNTERELSDAAFPLSPSARLIVLEFTQNPEPGAVDCAVFMLAPDGTGIRKFFFSDVFSGSDQTRTTAAIWHDLKVFLENESKKQSAGTSNGSRRKTSGKKEARRIVESIRPEEPLGEKLQKYDAAIALFPALRYRQERIVLLLKDLDERRVSLNCDEYLQKMELLAAEGRSCGVLWRVPKLTAPTPMQYAVLTRLAAARREAAIRKSEKQEKEKPPQGFIELAHSFECLYYLFSRSASVDEKDYLSGYPLYIHRLQALFENFYQRTHTPIRAESDSSYGIAAILLGDLAVWRADRKILYAFIPGFETSPNLLVRSVAERMKFIRSLDSLPPEEASAERLEKELNVHEEKMQLFHGMKKTDTILLSREIQVLAKKYGGAFPDEIVSNVLRKLQEEEKRIFHPYLSGDM